MLRQLFYSRVDTPFKLLKHTINNTFNNLTFNASVFPVPTENRLTFCNNLDTSSIDTFKKDLVNIAKYGTCIIVGLIFIITGLNCLFIWRRWRSMQGHFERTRQAWVSDPANAPQGNVMTSQAVFPSAPQMGLNNHNFMTAQAASPSAPQMGLSDHNFMTAQATSPSVPQMDHNDHNFMTAQVVSPPAPLSDHNFIKSQAASPPAPLSDHNFIKSQAASPPAPQMPLSGHNFITSQAASPSAPQMTLSDHNLMMLQADSEHPLITRIMYFLSARTGMTPTQNVDMRWFLHYVFHPPALACFLLGFFGLLSVMIQLFLLGPLLAAARAGVEIAVTDISNVIVNAINKTMYEQSATYANGVNSKVDVVQNAINHGLFGWVNGTTTTLNNTINHFYNDVQTSVTHLFNGTILEDPASSFLQCVVGNKVADIGKALTFLQDNLVIDLPRVSQDVLVLSARSVDEATAPIASGAVGSGSNGDQGLLGDAVAVYQSSLRAEAWLFGMFMGLWGIVLASAICVLLWRVRKRKKELAAAKLRSVKTELQMGLGHVKENNFSFPNDEKVDPFSVQSDVQVGLGYVKESDSSFRSDEKVDPFSFQSEGQEGLGHVKENRFSFPNNEKEDPFSVKPEVRHRVGLGKVKENKFSFPNDEKEDPFSIPSEVQVGLGHWKKENKFSYPNDEKKDPFMD